MLHSLLEWEKYFNSSQAYSLFYKIYGGYAAEQKIRYINALKDFSTLFQQQSAAIITAPGRTEIGGNHTDHQNGCVLAAAINFDTLCIASANEDNIIRIHSKGYDIDFVDISDIAPRNSELNKSSALIRGVAAWFHRNGYSIGGFDAYIVSDVLSGSGLSSSAAFEVAVGSIINQLYNGGKATAIEIALAGRFSENEYFGKPSGLMDQMASSVGGFVLIDFACPESPEVTPICFDLHSHGYSLCIVDTKGSHAGLTEHYASIPAEMSAVANYFNKTELVYVEEDEFYKSLSILRECVGDRAVLRAMHFFDDNKRVIQQAQALEQNDFKKFLRIVRASGLSSQALLQNIFCDAKEQSISIGLALSAKLLEPVSGVCRVHGGGFAGTIQAYVPNDQLNAYKTAMEDVFGVRSCHALNIRPVGGFVYDCKP